MKRHQTHSDNLREKHSKFSTFTLAAEKWGDLSQSNQLISLLTRTEERQSPANENSLIYNRKEFP